MTDILRDLRTQLESSIDEALTEETLKKLRARLHDAGSSLQEDFGYAVQTGLSYNLSRFVQRMAEGAIEDILKGNEEAFRGHLHCKEGCYTGRDNGHPIIHGRLFETGAIELRKTIVNAHPELLKSERILDLEDQVKSLVAQVNQLEAKREQLQRELNDWKRD